MDRLIEHISSLNKYFRRQTLIKTLTRFPSLHQLAQLLFVCAGSGVETSEANEWANSKKLFSGTVQAAAKDRTTLIHSSFNSDYPMIAIAVNNSEIVDVNKTLKPSEKLISR